MPELSNSFPVFRNLSEPIVVIRPRSSQSSAWTWGPQTPIRAVMLMPADVVGADTPAVAKSIGTDAEPTSDEDVTDPIEKALASAEYKLPRGGVGVIEFVEVGADGTSPAVSVQSPRRPSWDRIFFGYGRGALSNES